MNETKTMLLRKLQLLASEERKGAQANADYAVHPRLSEEFAGLPEWNRGPTFGKPPTLS